MSAKPEYRYQAASALYLGQRDNQEDALATDFALGGDLGFVVLSDGMGGHNAGDIASKVVVTEVFSELKLQSGDEASFVSNISSILQNAATAANECVADVAAGAPAAEGMGATLIVPVFVKDQLYWISIGDSPLYLYRSGHLSQLNEDHSMAPHIDLMVRTGMLSERGGRDHPDRNCLTSVLVGREISRIDCTSAPTQLFDGDIIVVASDGLQHLRRSQIQEIIARNDKATSEQIAERLIDEIDKFDAPDQDNVALCVVKICKRPKKSERGYDGIKYSKSDFLLDQPNPRASASWIANLRSSISRLFLPTSGSTQ